MSDKFTDPFRYIPSDKVTEAAKETMSFVERHCSEAFSEGKMLGVLVVDLSQETAGNTVYDSLVHRLDERFGFLAAFSGTADGKGTIPYFVPPVFDITVPGEYFREQEAAIVTLNEEISRLENSPELASLRFLVAKALSDKETEISEFRNRISESKRRRAYIREHTSAEDTDTLERLVRESQFEKAELKRLTVRHDMAISFIQRSIDSLMASLESMKSQRQEMSEALQQWIFRQYVVTNALGEKADIIGIFKEYGLVPPGGTGDCAAPKLLQYAFTHGLKPVAAGEFWYGRPMALSVRVHGHFYPSCQHKCGPLLGFMLRGLEMEKTVQCGIRPIGTVYEDDSIIVAEKPCGILSEPGKTGDMSLPELLKEDGHGALYVVHRLDMDTSGLIVYAKTPQAQQAIQRQFEEGTVQKTYMARLCAPDNNEFAVSRHLHQGDKGTISLPLSPAYEERPRQKADPLHGKEAVTEYEVTASLPSGETDVIFRPRTGRTHQLRVHSAHPDGLCRPIKGDMLYGGCMAGNERRLCLHAKSLAFRHPATGEEMIFDSMADPLF